jgi:hypothetical protein
MFYTANYFEREARGLATQCGVHHLLTKPAEPELILATVRPARSPARSQPTRHGRRNGVEAGAFDREHVR